MKAFSDCRLYTFVDADYLDGREPTAVASQLIAGGSDVIQWRAKGRTRQQTRRWAESLVQLTAEAGVRLVINDDPVLAAEIGAPCCHLGQEDFYEAGYRRVSDVRRSLGPGGDAIEVGLSTHSPEQAMRAVAAEPDYVAVGPVYATPTKPGRPGVTLEYVRWAAANLKVPWFAIGGITLENVEGVLEAGAARICVVSSILRAADPAAACREFLRRLGSRCG